MATRSSDLLAVVLACGALVAGVQAQVPDLGHYKLDEGAGQWVVNRAVPGGTTCGFQFSNTVGWVTPGPLGTGSAINFWPGTGGTDQALWTGIFLNYLQSFTIECWFRPETAAPSTYVFGDYNASYHRLYLSASTISWQGAGAAATANYPTGTYTSTVGTWTHIACVQDVTGTTNTVGTPTAPIGTPARLLYINGAFADAKPLPVLSNNPANVTGLSIGEYFPYAGGGRVSVGEFRVWSTARTGAAVLANFALSLPTTGFVPRWETNSPSASLTVDGQLGSACTAIFGSKCPGQVGIVAVNGLAGMGWEMALTLAPAVPLNGGGMVLGDQVLNLSLAAMNFLNGLTLPPFPGAFSIPFSAPVPVPALSGQLLVLDPAAPFGFALSHAVQIEVISPTATIPGPTGDDSNFVLVLGAAPLCGATSVPFFGTSYTSLTINSNGRMAFGSPVNPQCCPYSGVTPTPALLQNPQGGAWNDFDVTAGGSITVSMINGGTTVRASWNAVPYWNSGTYPSMPACTFALELNAASGVFSIDNVSGIGLHPGGTSQPPMWMGVTPGPNATYPTWVSTVPHGSAVYTIGPHFGPAVATDMIYYFNTPGTIAPGVNRIDFVPNGIGSYDYICQ